MSVSNTSNNNTSFVNNSNIDKLNKEESYIEDYAYRNSISTNGTFESDFLSDKDIDFNQDFFPKNKTFKLTDHLVDGWENNINIYFDKVRENLLKLVTIKK